MTASLTLLGYAVCAAWCAPALLAPLTRRGASVRAGLAAWLAAIASVLASAALAIWLSVAAAAADWPRLTQALCQSVAGAACTPGVYRSLLYQAGVTVLAAALALASAVALWRYTRRVQRSRSQTRAHAQAALLVGRAIADPRPAVNGVGDPAGTGLGNAGVGARDTAMGGRTGNGGRARTVVLDDPRPAAYCVAGHPAAIVVTSGALAVLDRPQLRAVLAHEGAHLAHGHHVLATVTRGLAAAFPGVPLFTCGAAEATRLAEMAADDSAARTAGGLALVTALLAIATGTAVSSASVRNAAGPASALAAATYAVPARVERLLYPSPPAAATIGAATLAALSAVFSLTPVALALVAR
jgi:Zn-dependent protease with chaperone function